MFLDDTACNLASLNLMRFCRADGSLDVDAFRHAVHLWTITLDISVGMAQYPSREIAWGSETFRTLGLGYANIGGVLMASGVPYDSPRGRAICGAVTAIMSGQAYKTSALMAAAIAPFPGFAGNRKHMLRVLRNRRRAASGGASGYEGLTINPVPLNHDLAGGLAKAANTLWDEAVAL